MAKAEAPALPGGTEAEWRAMVRREPKEANIGPGRKYKTRAAYEADVGGRFVEVQFGGCSSPSHSGELRRLFPGTGASAASAWRSPAHDFCDT